MSSNEFVKHYLLLMYVEDIIVASNNDNPKKLKRLLKIQCETRDLGELYYFLDIKVDGR